MKTPGWKAIFAAQSTASGSANGALRYSIGTAGFEFNGPVLSRGDRRQLPILLRNELIALRAQRQKASGRV